MSDNSGQKQSSISVNITGSDGDVRLISVQLGEVLMQAAKSENIAGIDADCGGSAACGTCVVAVAKEWHCHLPPMQSHESELLDFVCNEDPNMRLSCQIKATPELDGLILTVPSE